MELILVVFLPLIGSLISGFLGNRIGLKLSHFISCLLMITSFALSAYLFYLTLNSNPPESVHIFNWINSGNLNASWYLKFDTLLQ